MKFFIVKILFLLFFFCTDLLAQNRKSDILQNEPSWGYGSVLLVDGTTLVGKIKFKDIIGVVSWEDNAESRSFTSKNVAVFDFFDEKLNRLRVFNVLDYKDPETGINNYCFFEVLKEFKSFAVLTKIDPIKAEPKRRLLTPYTSPALVDKSSRQTITSQTETVYFINDQGAIESYLQIMEKETEGLFDYNRTSNKFIKKELLELYTGAHYNSLVEFATENKLSFKRKEDLIKILDRYQILISN